MVLYVVSANGVPVKENAASSYQKAMQEREEQKKRHNQRIRAEYNDHIKQLINNYGNSFREAAEKALKYFLPALHKAFNELVEPTHTIYLMTECDDRQFVLED